MCLPALVDRDGRDLVQVLLMADVPCSVGIACHLGAAVVEGLVLGS